MSFFDQRVYIKNRTALKIKAVEIHKELFLIHGDKSYDYKTVAKWSVLFRDGRESFEDNPRSGWPITQTTSINIDHEREVILDNPRSTFNDIEGLTGLSCKTK